MTIHKDHVYRNIGKPYIELKRVGPNGANPLQLIGTHIYQSVSPSVRSNTNHQG